MDNNIILRAAGPIGGEDGTVLTGINVYANNNLAAYYEIDGKNSITYDLYATANNDGIYLKVHDYNVANNLYCGIKKSIYHDDFGMAVASDITNVNGIIATSGGYIFRIDDLLSYYPIIKFNSSAIVDCTINGQPSSTTTDKISIINGETFDVNLKTALAFK